MGSTNNKVIAKNTIVLYLRMIISMLISFYTSRLILKSLGVVDFGIYNVVSGFVVMLSFLNLSLSNSTQRYLIYYLGKGNLNKLKEVFSASLLIHSIFALVIVVVCECAGLWYIHMVMVFPIERMGAALVAFHCSIVSLFFVIIAVPFYADIIAHEKMGAYAAITLIDAVLRLGIAIALKFSQNDRLVIYAILLMVSQISIQLSYGYYSKTHFNEVGFVKQIGLKLIKEMLAFSGWTIIGNLAFILYSQGTNMILNVFFGPIVNTARGLAAQVQGSLIQFCSSFQTAVNPQIIKQYASDDLLSMNILVLRSSKISFFLLYFISIPIFVEADSLMALWLEELPPYLVGFVRLSVLVSFITALANPFATAISATGIIKKYQLIIGGILLLNLPVSLLFLYLGFSPYCVYFIQLAIEIFAIIVRIIFFSSQISIKIFDYLSQVLLRIVITLPICLFIPLWLKKQLCLNMIVELITITIFSWFISVIFIYCVGMTCEERISLKSIVKTKLTKFK